MLVVTTNDIPGWEIRSRNAFAQIGAGFKSMFGGDLASAHPMDAALRRILDEHLALRVDLPA